MGRCEFESSETRVQQTITDHGLTVGQLPLRHWHRQTSVCISHRSDDVGLLTPLLPQPVTISG